jgi:hypothetical protein
VERYEESSLDEYLWRAGQKATEGISPMGRQGGSAPSGPSKQKRGADAPFFGFPVQPRSRLLPRGEDTVDHVRPNQDDEDGYQW